MYKPKKPEMIEILTEQVKTLTAMLASEGIVTGSDKFQVNYKKALKKSSPERILKMLTNELERLEEIKETEE